MKTIGVVVKQGKQVVEFEVDPNGPKMRFIRAVADIVENKKPYPDGCDIITEGVRIATDNPDFKFTDDAEGRKARGDWKSLAFPILYGTRSSFNITSTVTGRLPSNQRYESNTPKTSPTGRNLTEPEAQFIPLSWLKAKPRGPQRKK